MLKKLDEELKEKGISFKGMYYCPHMPKEKCYCRKPAVGMLEKAMNELNLDLENGWFIGDQTCDIEVGRRMGLKTILLETGKAGKDKKYMSKPDYTAKDLFYASIILNNK